ncbi:unnamed protein product [Porites evermanni]|uniref:Major facilitator superfamily (MFS) profile domain-containing protein n=1 Tax=Porites evermanni TaxID=104178 RepID=A0ABN8SG37_9CNID|nr:unnamed protein product [Porites evermanni]
MEEALPLLLENSSNSQRERRCYIPARYVLAALSCSGFCVVYLLRVNLSVALVAMVNSTYANEQASANNPECQRNSSTDSEEKDGEFNWDQKTQGLILGSFFFGYVITQLPGGWLGTRFGGKYLLGLGVLCTSVLTIFTPLAARHSVGMLILVRILEGLGEGVTFPAMHAMWSFWAPPLERSKLVTFSYEGKELGTILGMPLAGVLCASDIWGGWPSVFYAFGGVGILWFFIWMMFTYNRPANHPRISIKEREYIHATIGAGQDKGRRKYDTPWFAIFTSPAVWGIIVAHFCDNWGFYTFLTCLPSYFKEVLNFSISQNGLLSAVPFVCMCVTGIGSGQLADWMRENNVLSTGEVRKVLATGGYLIPACLMVATSYVGCNSTSLAVVLFSLALGASNLNAATYGVNHLDIAPRFSGVLMGITNSAGTIPGIIGPFVVGLLTDNQVCFWRNDYILPIAKTSRALFIEESGLRNDIMIQLPVDLQRVLVSNTARLQWQKVFYISAGMYVIGWVTFVLFASEVCTTILLIFMVPSSIHPSHIKNAILRRAFFRLRQLYSYLICTPKKQHTIMILDHSTLRKQIRPNFLRSISLLYKILPTSLGTCKPTFYTFYTSHLSPVISLAMEEALPLLRENSSNSYRQSRCYIPARYVLAALSCSGFCVVYLLRVNLSVALVAMVNSTYVNEQASANNPECQRNSSTDSEKKNGEFNWDQKTQGLILGSFFFGYVITQLPGGWLGTRFGGKYLLGLGVLFTSVLTIFTPLAARHSVGMLILVRILEGLGEGVTFPAMHAMWSFWAPPLERSKLITFSYEGKELGTILGMPLAGVLCASDIWGGWPSVFYVFGGVGILWSFIWMMFTYNRPANHPRISIKEREFIHATIGAGQDKGRRKYDTPWFAIFTSPAVWGIIVAHFCNNWGFYTFLTCLPSYFKEVLNFSISQNGLLSAVPFVCMCVTAIGSGQLADWMRENNVLSTGEVRKVLATGGYLIPACLMVATSYVGCNSTSLAVVLFSLALGASNLNAASYRVNHLDIAPRFSGVLMGITNSAGTIPGIIGPFVVGLLTDNQPTRLQWQKVFYISAGMYVIGWVTFVLFASGKVQEWNTPFEDKLVPIDTPRAPRIPVMADTVAIKNLNDSVTETSQSAAEC